MTIPLECSILWLFILWRRGTRSRSLNCISSNANSRRARQHYRGSILAGSTYTIRALYAPCDARMKSFVSARSKWNRSTRGAPTPISFYVYAALLNCLYVCRSLCSRPARRIKCLTRVLEFRILLLALSLSLSLCFCLSSLHTFSTRALLMSQRIIYCTFMHMFCGFRARDNRRRNYFSLKPTNPRGTRAKPNVRFVWLSVRDTARLVN